jgi:hypothetical protein
MDSAITLAPLMGRAAHDQTTMVPMNTEAEDVAAPLVRYRAQALFGFIAVPLLVAAVAGAPERPYVVIWLVAVLWIASWRNPNRLATVVFDWLPIVVIAAGYDLVRSFAPDLVPRAITEPQLRFDEIVFGGTVPTVLLQDWLRPDKGLHWFDYPVFLVYLSHFVVTPAFALFLYLTDRSRFKRFAWAILMVCLAGFVTYFVLPAEPPWLASRNGDLEPTIRVAQHVWAEIGAVGPARAFDGDAEYANPVGALPSLHAAWPFMIILFVWPTARRGRWVAVAYMAAMSFVLVYGSEHYVSDILLGWLYATIVFVLVNRTFDRRAALRAPEPAHG